MTVTLTGHAATDRAARWNKQLASHLGRKIDAQFDAETGTAVIHREDTALTMGATDAGIAFSVVGPDEQSVFTLTAIMQSHLERFAEKEGLRCEWDESELATRYAEALAEFEAKRAERKAAQAAADAAEAAAK